MIKVENKVVFFLDELENEYDKMLGKFFMFKMLLWIGIGMINYKNCKSIWWVFFWKKGKNNLSIEMFVCVS